MTLNTKPHKEGEMEPLQKAMAILHAHVRDMSPEEFTAFTHDLRRKLIKHEMETRGLRIVRSEDQSNG